MLLGETLVRPLESAIGSNLIDLKCSYSPAKSPKSVLARFWANHQMNQGSSLCKRRPSTMSSRTIRDCAEGFGLLYRCVEEHPHISGGPYVRHAEGFLNLLQNLDLAPRERPHKEGKILRLSRGSAGHPRCL
jgi:hypothetical protein